MCTGGGWSRTSKQAYFAYEITQTLGMLARRCRDIAHRCQLPWPRGSKPIEAMLKEKPDKAKEAQHKKLQDQIKDLEKFS